MGHSRYRFGRGMCSDEIIGQQIAGDMIEDGFIPENVDVLTPVIRDEIERRAIEWISGLRDDEYNLQAIISYGISAVLYPEYEDEAY